MATLANLEPYVAGTRYAPTLTRSTATLWAHQTGALRFALARPYSLLYSGMGTGKTLIALQYLEHFQGLKLVICPKRARVVWQADYDAFYQGDKPYQLIVLDVGTSAQKAKRLLALAQSNVNAVVVVNYDTAYRLPLNRVPFTAVVADEVHRLASNSGVQSRKLSQLCQHIPNKLGMTGTTHADGYERLYGIVRWLDMMQPTPRHYPQARLFGAYTDFINRYCETYSLGYTPVIRGYKNLSHLADAIRDFTLLIRTEDVINLPDAVYRRYSVPMTPDVAKQYTALRDESIITFEERDDAILAPNVLTRLLRLQQLTSSGELVTDSGEVAAFDITPRLDVLRAILEDIGDEPVIIFTRFNRDVERISEVVQEVTGQWAYRLTGAVDEHEAWQAGAGRVIIANLSAGSEGVRLYRAHHVVYWALTFSLKQYEQSKARARRHGQTSNTVYFHHILTEGTVDMTILDRLERKALDVSALNENLENEGAGQ